MRLSRLSGVLGGLLIAILASGSMRLAHLAIAHSAESSSCAAQCSQCPSQRAPAPGGSPGAPADPSHRECDTCALLAVLLPDGLPVADAPFFPASPSTSVLAEPDSGPSIEHIGLALARGPPARELRVI